MMLRMTAYQFHYLADLRRMDMLQQGMLEGGINVPRHLQQPLLDQLVERGFVRIERADDPLFQGWGGVKYLTTKGLRAFQRECVRGEVTP